MSMYDSYGVTRTFGNATYSATGFSSHEDALMNVHERAHRDGNWRPMPLREKWWQFWRPRQHTEIEAHFAAQESGE